MPENPFAEFSLERAIALRWALRDVQAQRLKMSPISSDDWQVLSDLGLVEMRDDGPALTPAGVTALGG